MHERNILQSEISDLAESKSLRNALLLFKRARHGTDFSFRFGCCQILGGLESWVDVRLTI